MPNKVTRYFFPVGHGAFYMEEIDGGLYVFDCGSMKAPFVAESRVNHFLAPDIPIEAVFISHLHSDHINGLERLLEWCHVKIVFLPLTLPEERLMLASASTRMFEREFILDPEKTVAFLRPDTKVAYIAGLPNDVDRHENDFQTIPRSKVPIDTIGHAQILHPCAAITTRQNHDWMFLPYSVADHSLRERFRSSVHEILIKHRVNPQTLTARDLPALMADRKARGELQRTYKDSIGEHNKYSMIVYSGPIAPDTRKWGALYLGDYNATEGNWNCVDFYYRQYISNLSVLTVPHHGAIFDYNKRIAELDCDKIISAKANRPPWHDYPHVDVILSLKRGSGSYYICSSVRGRKYIFQRGRRKSVKDVRYFGK